MKYLIKQFKVVIIVYSVILLGILGVLIYFSKSDIHIFINKNYSIFFDIFFKYITHFGDGILLFSISVLLIFVKYRYALVFFLSGLLETLLVQGLKNFVFKLPRPKTYFTQFYQGEYTLRFVPDIEVWSYNSFPSGHTATAFTLYFLLIFVLNKKHQWINLLLIILPFLVAYSRMYLSQHFLIDVYFGSIIGTLIAFIVFGSFPENKYPMLNKRFSIF